MPGASAGAQNTVLSCNLPTIHPVAGCALNDPEVKPVPRPDLTPPSPTSGPRCGRLLGESSQVPVR